MNTKTNEQILNDYYNCIHRKDIFIKILDRESEYWAVRRINQWKHNRNTELLKNTGLNDVNDWLINLNNQLAKLMNEILSELKKVVDWKENKITIENSNLEFRLRESLKHLKELPIGIKMNYDADKILALEMRNYCLNGFDLMIDFMKTALLVDIEKLPSLYLIQEVITNIKTSIDFEKVKFITGNNEIETIGQIKFDVNPAVKDSKPFSFQNNFDHVQNDRVYNYFKTELVDKNYLSLEDLHKYLIKAFQEKTLIAERFLLNGNTSIGIIRNIFYRYYSEIAKDKHGVKDKYCQLLGEYFSGFDTAKIKRNFNK